MSPVDQVQALIRASDPMGLDALLRGLGPEDQAEIRVWFVTAKNWFTEANNALYNQLRNENWRELAGSVRWMQVSCAIAVCPPAEAVRMIPWREFWDHQEPAARGLATALLCDAPREWAAKFLPAAAGVRIGAESARRAQFALAQFIGRGLEHHALPCPDGQLFLGGRLWAGARDAERALDTLRVDPLMPDLVLRVVEAGLAGNVAALPSIVPTLLEEGLADRTALRDTCLQALTVDSKVSAQRVVVAVLQALDLRGAEVDGGIDFVLGVMATRHGSVSAALLPCALELVDSPTALLDLTAVIAGRAERAPKKSLLRAIVHAGLREKLGTACLLEALELLADGDADASFVNAVATAREALGGSAGTAPDTSGPTGLWDLEPDPGPERQTRPGWVRYDDHLDIRQFLDRRTPAYDVREYEDAVPQLLRCLRKHPEPGRIAQVAEELRRGGSLALTRFSRILEPAFLGGGLRLLWPEAMSIADDVARSGRRLPGLAETMRVLTRYAHEVPQGSVLPPHLAALATESGNTQVHQEARALAAALGQSTGPAAPTTPETATRGLWDARPQKLALARLLDPHYSVAHVAQQLKDGVRQDLDTGRNRYLFIPGETPRYDGYLIDVLAIVVQKWGVDVCRRAVRDARKEPPRGPIARALDLWAGGNVTLASYAGQVTADRATGPLRCEHLAFAWALEQLVRLPTHPGTLSMPTRHSGAVDAEALVGRLEDFDGVAEVGPLDLLLTLLRLRPVPTEEHHALLARLQGVNVWTDPLSGTTSFDVVGVVREWLTRGWTTFDWTPYQPFDSCIVWADADHPEVLARVHPAHPSLPLWDVPDAGNGDRRDSQMRQPRLWRLVDGQLPTERISHLFWELLRDPTRSASTRDRARGWLADLAQHDGVLTSDQIAVVAVKLFRDGDLPLTRWTESLEWLFDHGALRVFWQAGLDVAAAACGEMRKPPGLPFLLTLLGVTAAEVPDPQLPTAIYELATSRGSTKSHAGARALVTAATR